MLSPSRTVRNLSSGRRLQKDGIPYAAQSRRSLIIVDVYRPRWLALNEHSILNLRQRKYHVTHHFRRNPSNHARSFTTSKPESLPRTYASAIAALNTLQSNYATVAAIRESGAFKNERSIPEMLWFFKRIGYSDVSIFDRLRVIHIAGTKGKGSTGAFVSSILAEFKGMNLSKNKGSGEIVLEKVGLYTSPHLRSVRERIQINGAPVSEEMFTKYFFEVWDRLEATTPASTPNPEELDKPSYFRFLTLLAFHVYLREGVDTAIIECGIGGEYDSTNFVQMPSMTGITSLAIDHVPVLGYTLEDIAWHKSGIMKKGVRTFTVPQLPSALEVLQKRAQEKGVNLDVIQRDLSIENGTVKLGLDADFQKTNASLAVALAGEHLRRLGADPQCLPKVSSMSINAAAISDMDEVPTENQSTPTDIPTLFQKGLAATRFPGRCEVRHENNIRWCIDGGHTVESLQLAAEWFAGQITAPSTESTPSQTIDGQSLPKQEQNGPRRILIFNQQTRKATTLAQCLYTAFASAMALASTEPAFHHVIFTTNKTFSDAHGGFKPELFALNVQNEAVESLSVQRELAGHWASLESPEANADIQVVSCLEDAVARVRNVAAGAEEVQVLVTGSLHLVGGLLEVIESGADRAVP